MTAVVQLENNCNTITSTSTMDWCYQSSEVTIPTTSINPISDAKIRELEMRVSVLENHIKKMQSIQNNIYTIVLGE